MARQGRPRKLSIIVPCFNEEATIGRLLDLLVGVELPVEREILVVDNGSSIPVAVTARRVLDPRMVTIFRLARNVGKGGAVRFGLRKASGDVVLVQDADLEYHPKDIPALLEPLLDGRARAVYGSRLRDPMNPMNAYHKCANRFLTCIGNAFFNQHLTDMETGYKLIDRALVDRLDLKSAGFDFDTEVTCELATRGIRIAEVPISYHPRLHGRSKIGIRDGVETLLLLFKLRFFRASRLADRLFRWYGHRVTGRLSHGVAGYAGT